MHTKYWRQAIVSASLAGAFLFLTSFPQAAEPTSSPVVNFGIVRTLFRDTPEAIITTLSRPLVGLMESQTGVTGDCKVVSDARAVAQLLESRQIHLAMVHSFEYGWARKANPKIRPLVVANRLVRDNRYVLVVRQDSAPKATTDLKGSKVAIPVMTKEPAHLFLEVKCCENCTPASFFKETVSTGDADEALDSVILREANAALVEKTALDAYFKAKPKQVSTLKVLKISEDFPSGVIVYREGHLPDNILQRFRNGLVGAATNPRARDLMKLARLAGFDPATPAYDAQVEELLKVYPAPVTP